MFKLQQSMPTPWAILLMLMMVLANTNATTKPNLFDPILSSDAYIGHIKENERIVDLQPRLYASDPDPSTTPNGKICGYELSLHKHDDQVDVISPNIPFTVELINNQAVIKLKSNINKLDCEIKQTYHLFLRAYDCANDNQRRYSERSTVIITIDDVNEFAPVFTHKNYLFKLHQIQTCSSCRVEATDDDCANNNHRVCDYQIRTSNVPFTIDSNGSISITKPLTNEKYEFDVVAIDCYPSSVNDGIKLMSEPARVTIKIIKSCKPTIADNNPTKLTIHSDHTHIFDTVHVDACDETCVVEDIVGTVTLDSDGIDSGCNLKQCSSINREYVLIPKDTDYDRPPQSRYLSFDGVNQASIVHKTDFSGQFNNDFTIQMWMKHSNGVKTDKEHVFCKSDEKLKNRHHTALLIQNDHLKLLIRKGPLLSNDKTVHASEWKWQLSQLNDDQWHSYKLFVNYPKKIDLYIDDQLFVPTDDNFQVVEDFALTTIEGTGEPVFALGACWHGRTSNMVQHFHGLLSGLTIQQKEELPRSAACIQDCQQYLDMPDIQSDPDTEFHGNTNRSIWTLRADSSESFEQLLKHIVYRNTLHPIGPSGQRTVSIQTSIKCLGENYTYNLPTFTRRLSIDEIIRPTNIELKGDTNFFVSEETLNQGIYVFQNLSIFTDDMKKEQVDITDCSINTTPDLSNGEQLIVPDENLDINNLQKDLTQTGLVLSGSGSIDSYQFILQQIAYVAKSPVKYTDRTFSLVCIGANEQVTTNEIRVRIHVEKQVAPAIPVSAVASNKLYVDNDPMADDVFDSEPNFQAAKDPSGWPIAVGICVSVSLAAVLVLYFVVRIRSANKQRNPIPGPGDDPLEWEDDIGLNIIVNPLEETKKPAQSMNLQNIEQMIQEYDGTSSEGDECDSHNEYSSENEDDDDDDDDEDNCENNQIHAKKHNHQLEWDDEAMEYGARKV